MKPFLLSIFLLSSLIGWGQFLNTVVDEGDKWTKIYENPSYESKVVDSTYCGWIFEIDWESYLDGNDWVKVYIPTSNTVSFIKYMYDNTVEGFVHRSRILPLDSMEVYDGDNFTFNWYVKPFDTLSHTIEHSEYGELLKIDGVRPYGTIVVPHIEVDSVNILFNGSIQHIPYRVVKDIYDDGKRTTVFSYSDYFFVKQVIGDGSETFWVGWVFTEYWLLQRYISWGP
jgi:hypothetical protein